jgi:hypothetical protein
VFAAPPDSPVAAATAVHVWLCYILREPALQLQLLQLKVLFVLMVMLLLPLLRLLHLLLLQVLFSTVADSEAYCFCCLPLQQKQFGL